MRSRSSPLLPYTNGERYSAKQSKGRTRFSLIRGLLLLSLAAFLAWSIYTVATIATFQNKRPGRTRGDQARLAKLSAEQQGQPPATQTLKFATATLKKAGDKEAKPCDGEEDCLATHHTADVAAQAADTVAHVDEAAKTTGLFDLEAEGIDGSSQPLSEFAGKVVVVVNVASQCGYTDSNYKGLQQLYEKHKNAGFEVLAFPCNQFGDQEPDGNAAIQQFAASRYHATFPMFAKVGVNGPQAAAVFKFLKSALPESEGGGGGSAPGTDLNWNFNKFLVNRQGQPVKHYPPAFDFDQLDRDVTALLQGNGT